MASLPVSKKRKRSQEPEIKEDVASPIINADVPETAEIDSPKALSPQEVSNIQKKIFHTIKEAGRAFKKAKDFEVRKIIKRMKAAKYASLVETDLMNRDAGETGKLERLEKELQIAKVFSMGLPPCSL
jgi:Glu-tRNA(Gln) amidotransferase subunit E-like FAD-binding protein